MQDRNLARANRTLALAVIAQAFDDWEYGFKVAMRRALKNDYKTVPMSDETVDVERFMRSEWLEFWCDAADVPQDRVQAAFKQKQARWQAEFIRKRKELKRTNKG